MGIDMTKVNIKTSLFSMGDIVEYLKKDGFVFDEIGKIDVRIIEMLIIHLYGRKLNEPLMVRDNKDDKYEVYQGHGLLRAIKYYIVDNNPLENLTQLTDYEGCTFSSLPRSLQRRFLETSIDMYIDYSYYHTNNNSIITTYRDVLNNIK